MVRLQIRIVPEKELPAYHPGEMIRGRILVRAKEQISFTRLEMSLFSQPLEGDGVMSNSQTGMLDKQGEWTAERDMSYKFAFAVPATPEHWDERHLHSWHLRVTADIAEDFGVDEALRIWVVAPGEERQILQNSDEALQEPGTPGGPAKVHQKASRPALKPAKVQVKVGELVTSLLLSLIPLGFLVGGMVLALNGVNTVKVPGAVRVFGLLAMLGSFFVLRKFTEVKGLERLFQLANGTLAALVGLLGCYIALVDVSFCWMDPHLADGRTDLLVPTADWNFWMGLSTALLFMPLAGYLYTGQKAMPEKLFFMMIAAPLVLVALLLAVQLVHVLQTEDSQDSITTMALLTAGSAVGAIWALVKAEWRNAPFAFVCLASTPLVLVALSAFGQGSLGVALGVALLLALVYFLYMGSRNLLAQRSIGKVTVICDPLPGEVLLGNTQTTRVEFNPRHAVVIDYILVEWICTRHHSYLVGTDRRSETTEVFRHRDHQARNAQLTKGVFFRSEHSCTILPSMEPSSDSNPSYTWRLKVSIVVKGSPDWDEEVALNVQRG